MNQSGKREYEKWNKVCDLNGPGRLEQTPWIERVAQRRAHLECLRAKMQIGTYQIDYTALARCILIKETYFFHWE